jgi:hypothetical protein
MEKMFTTINRSSVQKELEIVPQNACITSIPEVCTLKRFTAVINTVGVVLVSLSMTPRSNICGSYARAALVEKNLALASAAIET